MISTSSISIFDLGPILEHRVQVMQRYYEHLYQTAIKSEEKQIYDKDVIATDIVAKILKKPASIAIPLVHGCYQRAQQERFHFQKWSEQARKKDDEKVYTHCAKANTVYGRVYREALDYLEGKRPLPDISEIQQKAP